MAGVVALLGSVAFADNTATPTPTPGGGKRGHGPCQKIIEACKGANFVKGEWKEGTGLYKDCFDPILAGKSVPNVSVDPATVSACNEVRAKRKNKEKSGPPQQGNQQ